MKTAIRSGFAIAILSLATINLHAQDVLSYVDPNIGTAHSRWFFYTPAAVPYGMAKLAPSTNGHYGNASGWEAVGYDTRHNSIEGFVHFHEWQVGGVSVMPATGELKIKPGELDKPGSGYRSHFDRKNQIAQPGYYKVLLDDYHITAELTATKHVGFHRYTFPKNDRSRIIFDIGNTQGESGEVRDAGVKMTDATHFEGYVITYPKYVKKYDPDGQVQMCFYGEVSKAPASVGSFNNEGIKQQSKEAKGKGAGIFLNYKTQANEAIELKVGLSYTSIANAKANLAAEATGLTFDKAKQQAQATWRTELGKIMVQGGDRVSKVKFYTGLFHGLLGRGIANDVNGSFPRHDGTIGRLPKDKQGRFSYNFYNTDAIWGAYWNLTQLWALAYPSHYNDYVHTQLEIYKERSWFGDGIANSNFVSGVGTNFVGLTIAAAYQVGIRDYDVNLAYQAIRANELSGKDRKEGSGKMDVDAFVKYGYSPYLDGDYNTDSTGSHFSASHTLEYSFSAFAAAQMAKNLGKTDDYKLLIKNSNGWRYIFDKDQKLMRPKRADGSFIDKFDPAEPWRGFQEGNAIQYTYFVPQNPKGLVDAVGKDEFNTRLNNIFETSENDGFSGGKTIDAFAGIKSLYNHGNQPCLHTSWLFNFSGKPWLTQKWTRAICDEFYGIEPIHGYGYGQDEDQGQLGSWYVMASLGLFDVKGFTDFRPIVELSSPVFNSANIALGNGKKLNIQAINNSKTNVYIQSASFNGKPLNNCWLYRDELMKGGKLVLRMGSKPNEAWGVKVPPPSVQ
ncbi:GH92 family glycosyl hydrolase [Mucilaginibacter sp. dw_454]|uniref:GH92 family glycosyl hydrolase n=1 Tax=Mucilaginibacter sp. dw_454 TaxID=2720079 RepID=UPI001BD45142|nr:GH92 family glycosyl hydrolase [Mucilaginibacter sp. dw_454]